VKAHPGIAVGTMGSWSKQTAATESLALEFTYGVIDKCILRALRGQDSLILTTASMVGRIHQRIDSYGKESGTCLTVQLFSSRTAGNDPETKP
jgi:cobalt/nickel transport system ATP-binding protein